MSYASKPFANPNDLKFTGEFKDETADTHIQKKQESLALRDLAPVNLDLGNLDMDFSDEEEPSLGNPQGLPILPPPPPAQSVLLPGQVPGNPNAWNPMSYPPMTMIKQPKIPPRPQQTNIPQANNMQQARGNKEEGNPGSYAPMIRTIAGTYGADTSRLCSNLVKNMKYDEGFERGFLMGLGIQLGITSDKIASSITNTLGKFDQAAGQAVATINTLSTISKQSAEELSSEMGRYSQLLNSRQIGDMERDKSIAEIQDCLRKIIGKLDSNSRSSLNSLAGDFTSPIDQNQFLPPPQSIIEYEETRLRGYKGSTVAPEDWLADIYYDWEDYKQDIDGGKLPIIDSAAQDQRLIAVAAKAPIMAGFIQDLIVKGRIDTAENAITKIKSAIPGASWKKLCDYMETVVEPQYM